MLDGYMVTFMSLVNINFTYCGIMYSIFYYCHFIVLKKSFLSCPGISLWSYFVHTNFMMKITFNRHHILYTSYTQNSFS